MNPEKDPAIHAETIPQNPEIVVELSPAEELGLIDGQFWVPRGEGDTARIETGWTVTGSQDVIDPKTGEPETAVSIMKPYPTDDDPNNYAFKKVRLSEIRALTELAEAREARVAESRIGGVALLEAATIQEDTGNSYLDSSDGLIERYGERNVRLFAPVEVEVQEESPLDGSEYDHLFSDEEIPGGYSIEAAARSEAKGRGISTESSERFTTQVVLPRFSTKGDLSTSNVAEEIKQFVGSDIDIDSPEAMEEIRNNPELRLRLGQLFLHRQDLHSHMLPDRVRSDTDKTTNVPGYKELSDDLGKLTSREYVALLALAKLDGTFNIDNSMSDPVRYDSEGNVIQGQHRAASDVILFT